MIKDQQGSAALATVIAILVIGVALAVYYFYSRGQLSGVYKSIPKSTNYQSSTDQLSDDPASLEAQLNSDDLNNVGSDFSALDQDLKSL